MGLFRRSLSFAGAALLRMRGVEVGRGLVLFGLPLVRRAPGSRLALGARVVLCSTCYGNPLGVAHPVILRTLRPDSVIRIGDDTGMSGATVCAASSVTIGAQCLIGANVTITDYDFHAVAPANRRYATNPDAIGCAPVVIEDNVWIGLNTVILKGVTIGADTVVGAGSVVTRSLPPRCVAAGQPARVIRLLEPAADASAAGRECGPQAPRT